ncbi:ThiF family adenylyltransferase [Marinicrinis sediminis]|uniref:ThiF family adenylyltransferase n=1 Tax=Marinicrinis sediminis TaxID=1652465 RepID=A0ABW5RC17_9BACL
MEERLERYSRQTRFQPIGLKGQEAICTSHVVIVGMGALGTVLANHMVRAGVARLTLIDRDYVEPSNLQRQMLYDERDAEQALPKVIAAERKLTAIREDVSISAHLTDLTRDNVQELLAGADLVLDGTDNFSTRLLLNDACYQLGMPYLYSGVVGSEGMTATFVPGETGCFRCLTGLYEHGSLHGSMQGETCDTAGVISPAVDMVASLQAAEAIKLLSGHASDRLWVRLNCWPFASKAVPIPDSSPVCPVCRGDRYPSLEPVAHEEEAVYLCGRESFQFPTFASEQSMAEWAARFRAWGKVQVNPYVCKVELPEGERLILFTDGRVLIQGTDELSRAKSLYARYIGN